MNSSNPYDGERRAGTVGFPLPNIELRVVDPETGDELPKGEIGNLEVAGQTCSKDIGACLKKRPRISVMMGSLSR